MDAVITYVDGNDPLWREDYAAAVGGTALTKRYRDYGTLKYLLRGIEKHMPFIRRVHLVVARESQVPAWIDPAQVHVVFHRDILPASALPTFNSTTIEMFLHRIPDLDGQFLYFNDDMFPLRDCTPEDFFPEGKGAMGYSRHLLANNLFRIQTRNCSRRAQEALGLRQTRRFVRPQHTCSPMLKRECEQAFAAQETYIRATLTPLRDPRNLSQYYFLDYQYFKGKSIHRRISNKHISLGSWTLRRMDAYLRNPERKMACINDVRMSESRSAAVQKLLLERFEALFPEKSRFEK